MRFHLESTKYQRLLEARRKLQAERAPFATRYTAINNELGRLQLPRDRRKRESMLAEKTKLEGELTRFKLLLGKNHELIEKQEREIYQSADVSFADLFVQEAGDVIGKELFDEITRRARLRLDKWLEEFNCDELSA